MLRERGSELGMNDSGGRAVDIAGFAWAVLITLHDFPSRRRLRVGGVARGGSDVAHSVCVQALARVYLAGGGIVRESVPRPPQMLLLVGFLDKFTSTFLSVSNIQNRCNECLCFTKYC